MKYCKLTTHMLFLFVVICTPVLLALSGCKPPRKMSKAQVSQAFKQYVLDPIPKSVTSIRAHQPSETLGCEYTFRFSISREDLSRLIDSGPFIRIWNVKYEGAVLRWGWERPRPGQMGMSTSQHYLPLYQSGWKALRKPAWFKPGRWENPEAYGFFKSGNLVNIQAIDRDARVVKRLLEGIEPGPQNVPGPTILKILLYNEKEGEAYFVVDVEN